MIALVVASEAMIGSWLSLAGPAGTWWARQVSEVRSAVEKMKKY